MAIFPRRARRNIAAILAWLASYIAWRGSLGPLLFLKHQIQSRCLRIGDTFRVFDPDTGAITLRAKSTDLQVFLQVIIRQEYACPPKHETILTEQYEIILQRGKVPLIIDAGGNIGLFAVYIAKKFPRARIVCVEPARANMEIAQKNCRILKDLIFVEGVIWRSNGWVVLDNPEAAEWAYSYSAATDDPAENRVKAFSIDSIVESHPDTELLLLKLDIEGAEKEALAASADFWEQRPIIFIEPHDEMPGISGSLRGLLCQHEYTDADVVIRGENLMIFPL